jgi:hypothetical protein
VIGERLRTAAETFPFIASTFARRRLRCKAYSSILPLAAIRLVEGYDGLNDLRKPPSIRLCFSATSLSGR